MGIVRIWDCLGVVWGLMESGYFGGLGMGVEFW
nr:MAG TPA: hypothetical protein [Bacteriophage sp.]